MTFVTSLIIFSNISLIMTPQILLWFLSNFSKFPISIFSKISQPFLKFFWPPISSSSSIFVILRENAVRPNYRLWLVTGAHLFARNYFHIFLWVSWGERLECSSTPQPPPLPLSETFRTRIPYFKIIFPPLSGVFEGQNKYENGRERARFPLVAPEEGDREGKFLNY